MYMNLGRAVPAPRAIGETSGSVTPLAFVRVLDTTSQPFACICRIQINYCFEPSLQKKDMLNRTRFRDTNEVLL
jgi:hypothetical protein